LREPPLALSISLDRKEYLPRELILFEWTLSNPKTYRVHYYPPEGGAVLYLERLDGRREKRVLGTTSGIRHGSLPLITLGPKRTTRDCFPLRGCLSGLYGLGKFKLWGECRVPCCATIGEKPVFFDLKSNEVVFTVVKAGAADADAIALIDKMLLKGYEDFMDEEGREDLCNKWPWKTEVLEALLAQKGSARFRAAAAYRLGHCTRPAQGEELTGNSFGRDKLRQAIPYFKDCVASEGASLYLKGLAEAELLDLTAMEKGKTHPQTLKMAEAIRARYPKTLMANRAQALLDEAARKKN
jgi:hypothetical protein